MAKLLNFAKDIDTEHPRAGIEALRALGPVVPMKMPLMGKIHVTTTHQATAELLTQRDRFVSEPKNAGKSGSPFPFPLPPSVRYLMDGFIQKDEPDHRRLRGFVDKAFAKRSVTELADASHDYSIELVDGMRSIAQQNGSVDYLAGFSTLMPMRVISVLLGFPPHMQERFLDWMKPLRQLEVTPWGIFRMLGSVGKASKGIEAWSETLVNSDAEGLIAELVNLQEGNDRLSSNEMKAIVFTLIIAGGETTTHLLNGALWYLLKHPEMKKHLRANPDDIPGFVEEMLRWFCPLTTTKPRLSACDQEFGGVALKAGDMIFPSLLAANTDEAVFTDPWTFDLQRSNAVQHMAFGSGIHNCLGRPLVRIEAQAALEALLDRWPDFQADEGGKEPWYVFKNTMGRRNFKWLRMRSA
jgi:cytochrome P450